MQNQPDTSTAERRQRKWLRKIVGALPILFLMIMVVVIVSLVKRIQTEQSAIQEARAAEMKQERPDVNVVALNLIPSVLRDRINLPGVVEPWVDLTVLAEVGAKVIAIEIEEGQRVRKGAVIARLDMRDYQHALNSARATYNAALSNKKRTKELQKSQLSTRSSLDNAVAQVETAKAALDNAELNLERCTIKAPISGIINYKMIEVGQFLSRSDPVVQIIQMDRVKVKVGIPESDVEAVRKLDDFEVIIDALDGKVFKGKKHFLSKRADLMARVYNLNIEVNNPKTEILPDMFVRVEIVKQRVEDGIAVPLYAVVTRNSKHHVYVVNDDMAHTREVDLGFQEGWRIEVKKGLEVGEKVIVVGQRSVNDGQRIKVVRSVDDPGELNE
jgi:RND family efflux transporter MFP subunit